MKSLDELKVIRERAQHALKMRESGDGTVIQVAMGTCGIAAGARGVMIALLDELVKRERSDVLVTQTGCAGLCEKEPIVTVKEPEKSDVVYGDVTDQKARDIIAKHIVNGQIVSDYVLNVKEA